MPLNGNLVVIFGTAFKHNYNKSNFCDIKIPFFFSVQMQMSFPEYTFLEAKFELNTTNMPKQLSNLMSTLQLLSKNIKKMVPITESVHRNRGRPYMVTNKNKRSPGGHVWYCAQTKYY